MNIIYSGNYYEGFNVLKEIYKAYNVKIVFADIKEIRNSQIINFCKKKYIELISSEKINDKETIAKIRNENIDLIVVNNFKRLIDYEVLSSTRYGGINLHSSLLPNYKGRAPISWAIINGEKETGITIHYIDGTIDGGNIILQKKIHIEYNDDYQTLLKKNVQLEPEMFLEAIKLVGKGYQGKKQAYEEKVFPYISKKYRIIDWNHDSIRIYNIIRALVPPFPGAVAYLNQRQINIFRSKEKRNINNQNFSRGEVIKIGDKSIEVFCEPKTIEIFDLKDNMGNNLTYLINEKIIHHGVKFKRKGINDTAQ